MSEFAAMVRRILEKPKPLCGCRVAHELTCTEPVGHAGPHIDKSGRWWA